MHTLQRPWVQIRHLPTQWNLRGGRWSSSEYCKRNTWKKNEIRKILKFIGKGSTFVIDSWDQCFRSRSGLIRTVRFIISSHSWLQIRERLTDPFQQLIPAFRSEKPWKKISIISNSWSIWKEFYRKKERKKGKKNVICCGKPASATSQNPSVLVMQI